MYLFARPCHRRAEVSLRRRRRCLLRLPAARCTSPTPVHAVPPPGPIVTAALAVLMRMPMPVAVPVVPAVLFTLGVLPVLVPPSAVAGVHMFTRNPTRTATAADTATATATATAGRRSYCSYG